MESSRIGWLNKNIEGFLEKCIVVVVVVIECRCC